MLGKECVFELILCCAIIYAIFWQEALFMEAFCLALYFEQKCNYDILLKLFKEKKKTPDFWFWLALTQSKNRA